MSPNYAGRREASRCAGVSGTGQIMCSRHSRTWFLVRAGLGTWWASAAPRCRRKCASSTGSQGASSSTCSTPGSTPHGSRKLYPARYIVFRSISCTLTGGVALWATRPEEGASGRLKLGANRRGATTVTEAAEYCHRGRAALFADPPRYRPTAPVLHFASTRLPSAMPLTVVPSRAAASSRCTSTIQRRLVQLS
jgi:hypothetical protein